MNKFKKYEDKFKRIMASACGIFILVYIAWAMVAYGLYVGNMEEIFNTPVARVIKYISIVVIAILAVGLLLGACIQFIRDMKSKNIKVFKDRIIVIALFMGIKIIQGVGGTDWTVWLKLFISVIIMTFAIAYMNTKSETIKK